MSHSRLLRMLVMLVLALGCGLGPLLAQEVLRLDRKGVPTAPPAAPTDLRALAITDTEVRLEWRDNARDEEGFEVQIRSDARGFRELGTVPANTSLAFASQLEPGVLYAFRVRALNAAGASRFSNVARSRTPLEPPDFGPAGSCVHARNVLCLDQRRFQVEVEFQGFDGVPGKASVAPALSDGSGIFWFFDPDNWEMLVKVLDGCRINGHFWLFAAVTSDVEYTLRLEDTVEGTTRTYTRSADASANLADIRAIPCP